VYEIGDAVPSSLGSPAPGPVAYLVMELVEGETLAEKVTQSGRLAPSLALRYGACIAGALDHAHRRGVLHRDLKSANVMISGGDAVKVLDFGLARWLPEAAELQASASFATDTMALAGTLNYMAPEVLLGGAADPRSDIWSLGILLFEMAAGSLPYKGQTGFETASAIMRAEVPPLPAGVPLGLRLVIGRCLAKDPARRYQRAADVLAALEALQGRGRRRAVAGLAFGRIRSAAFTRAAALACAVIVLATGASSTRSAGGAPLRRMRTVAVLPLERATGGAADAQFADGLTEALIGELGETGVDRVISRTTVMKFRGARTPIADIARELGVEGILEGSVDRSAGFVRLSVRLHDGSTGRVVWSTSQERAPREAAALVAEVARAVAGGMNLELAGDLGQRFSAVRAVDPDVYEAYLKGRYNWNERTEVSIGRAVEYYQEAIRLDPTFAPAHAALADCYNQLGTVMVGTGSPTGFRLLARASVIKALQIDANLAEAHATLGYVRHYDLEWEEAEREFVQAIRLNPSYALAHIWYANLLAGRRRFAEAVREVQLARDLDPYSLAVNTNVARTLDYAGRRAEAIAQLRHTLELDPAYVQAHMRLGGMLAAAGRIDEAMAEAQTTFKLMGGSPPSLGLLAEVNAKAGRLDETRALLERLLRASRERYVPPGIIADIYEELGDADNAIAWLEKAYVERSNKIAYLAADSHALIRSDPRFGDLLRRAGLD
jgi:TolB-like protein/Tfp pilus assembly protein PilF